MSPDQTDQARTPDSHGLFRFRTTALTGSVRYQPIVYFRARATRARETQVKVEYIITQLHTDRRGFLSTGASHIYSFQVHTSAGSGPAHSRLLPSISNTTRNSLSHSRLQPRNSQPRPTTGRCRHRQACRGRDQCVASVLIGAAPSAHPASTHPVSTQPAGRGAVGRGAAVPRASRRV